ncbi:MAG: aspartyl/asparaginyl beta-hydroxylase domain-containing protein [Gammaproteobacteria bacterium]
MRLAREGRAEEAAAAFDEVLRAEPDHLSALSFLARRAWAAGNMDEGISLLERALRAHPEQPALHVNLGLMHAGRRDIPAAVACFDEALKHDPDHFMAMLHKAALLDQAGRPLEAAVPYLQALTKIAGPPKIEVRPELVQLLQRARTVVQKTREHLLVQKLGPLRKRHSPQELERLGRCIDIYLGITRPDYPHPKQRPATMFFPGLPPRPFFEREEFPWIGQIEAATPRIREELRTVMESPAEFKPYVDKAPGTADADYWKAVNRSSSWSTYRLFRIGERVEEHCLACPETGAALESIPLMRAPLHAPEAMFSVLEPHTRIPAHHGSVNGRLIVHLPLIVPENCGGLRVGDETRSWREGECLIFDDSFAHEAWNDSDETRVVLIFDIWNPLLTEVEKEGFAATLEAMGRFDYEALGEAALKDG